MSYNANYFLLRKHEQLPVQVYSATITPKPALRPQSYQILNIIARRLTGKIKTPTISLGTSIETLGSKIPNGLLIHEASIPGVGQFHVQLTFSESRQVKPESFEEYKLLVNRILDTALTVLSPDYYKFHPDAPYIIRDEPYFDPTLIDSTGIIDSKKYYRTVRKLGDDFCIVMNRETELRSYKNLLVEIGCLKNRFEERTGSKVDQENPSKAFIDYVNSLLRGKSGDVVGYPGPSIRPILGVDWSIRAKDPVPGSTKSCYEYFRDNYGITLTDENQPTITYRIYRDGRSEVQHHVPELLSVGHDFEDLEARIPPWQRPQVWNLVQPNCKNQLQKVYEVLARAVITLEQEMPTIYPNLIEIDTNPLSVTRRIKEPSKFAIRFQNKKMTLIPPYDKRFYRAYSGKDIRFKNSVSGSRALVHIEDTVGPVDEFLNSLSGEFKLRNGSELTIVKEKIDFADKNYTKYDVVFTITESDREGELLRERCKKVIQNAHGITHQHITKDMATTDSVMAIIMQLALKKGADPWLLDDPKVVDFIAGVYRYMPNEESETASYYFNILEGDGKLLYQSEGFHQSEAMFSALSKALPQKHRGLILVSFQDKGLSDWITSALQTSAAQELAVLRIQEGDGTQLFSTWVPDVVPGLGRRMELPMESYEEAPQGIVLENPGQGWYVLTGKTIEKNTLKRGCPAPILVKIVHENGVWDNGTLLQYVLSLCFMGRASGHMTRVPSPIYYLRQLAHYDYDFGLPSAIPRKDLFFV